MKQAAEPVTSQKTYVKRSDENKMRRTSQQDNTDVICLAKPCSTPQVLRVASCKHCAAAACMASRVKGKLNAVTAAPDICRQGTFLFMHAYRLQQAPVAHGSNKVAKGVPQQS
jgi:hypothetical protein